MTQKSDHSLSRGALGTVGIIVMSTVLMGPAISLFFNTPVMAASAGAAVPLAYLASMVAVLFTAYTVAQFSRKIASAGSFYGFVTEAVGPKSGFLVGWCTFGAYGGIAMAGGLISGAFLSSVIETHTGVHLSFLACAVAIFVVSGALAFRGVKLSERFAIVMLGIELATIVIIVAAILLQGGAHGLSAAPFDLGGASLSGIRSAMVFGIFAFIGFEISASLAEETPDPRRSVPIAVIGCTLVVGAIFVIGSYAMVMGYGIDQIDKLSSDASAYDTLTGKYAPAIQSIGDIILVQAQIGAMIAIVTSFARIAFSLGRSGLLPAPFGKTHRTYRTPYAGIGGIVAAGVAAALLSDVNGVDGVTAYNYVGTPAIILILLVFIASNISVGRFYKARYPNEYNVVRHIIVPWVGILVLMIPLVAQFYPQPPAPLNWLPAYSALWIILGLGVLAFNRDRVASLGPSILADSASQGAEAGK
ncbi:APC family permease [Labrys monachus]|uniref:Amino acid transporter n=1 Tax=Labrys monachus TaxID=217067 RepID=A0ABU0FAZ8_9HYPH|nr:APC family permease [Labrys monachus]MDQ0391794.1 amino acid transporter [Labrys monachus]